jgi:CheY-like chemotaxis protein
VPRRGRLNSPSPAADRDTIVGSGKGFEVRHNINATNGAGLRGGPSSTSLDEASLTILYIEDNASNFMLVQSIFSFDPEVELVWAASGREGIEFARSRRPGLILLDVHLPDAYGEDVLKRLKSDPLTSATPVIALTADTRRQRRELLLAAGAAAFFTKPIDIRGLRELVASIRDERR